MQWYCERCAAYCQAEYRYMLSLQLEDHTGKEWVTAFQVSCHPPRSDGCSRSSLRAVILPRHAEAQKHRQRTLPTRAGASNKHMPRDSLDSGYHS